MYTKTKIAFIFIFFATISIAQEKKIVNLLNDQLRKEIREFSGVGDSMTLIKPFSIDENKILQFQVSVYNFETEETELISQEVVLDKITGFIKDINVIFETEKDAVKIKRVKLDKNNLEIFSDTSYYHLFFTQINRERENENFRDKILEAFSKAGYKINSEFWAD